MSATSAPPVASAFASNASPTFPPHKRCAIMPEPTMASNRNAVPTPSATTERAFTREIFPGRALRVRRLAERARRRPAGNTPRCRGARNSPIPHREGSSDGARPLADSSGNAEVKSQTQTSPSARAKVARMTSRCWSARALKSLGGAAPVGRVDLGGWAAPLYWHLSILALISVNAYIGSAASVHGGEEVGFGSRDFGFPELL